MGLLRAPTPGGRRISGGGLALFRSILYFWLDPDRNPTIDIGLFRNISSYMSRDSRLSGVLHILIHLAEAEAPVPSEKLALAMRTNAVVVRRVMAGLRDGGLVRSGKGHGGGWSLARAPATVTLRDVYAALGSPELFAIGNRSETPTCLVEQAVNVALDDALRDAGAVLLARMDAVTLATLAEDFHRRLAACGMAVADMEHA